MILLIYIFSLLNFGKIKLGKFSFKVNSGNFMLGNINDYTVELRRHARNKIPVNQRMCKHCTIGETEDEIHFLLRCPKFDPYRQSLLQYANLYFPDFKSMTTESETELMIQFSKFVYTAFEVDGKQA